MEVVEQATGKTVQTRWSKGDRKLSEFRELEGMFVRILMHMIEPKASEAALANDLKAIRAAAKREKNP